MCPRSAACLAAGAKKTGPDRKLFLGGYTIANQLIGERSHSFFELLSAKADRTAEAALQVLTEVVRFGGSLARTALTQIDWSLPLSPTHTHTTATLVLHSHRPQTDWPHTHRTWPQERQGPQHADDFQVAHQPHPSPPALSCSTALARSV